MFWPIFIIHKKRPKDAARAKKIAPLVFNFFVSIILSADLILSIINWRARVNAEFYPCHKCTHRNATQQVYPLARLLCLSFSFASFAAPCKFKRTTQSLVWKNFKMSKFTSGCQPQPVSRGTSRIPNRDCAP